MTARAPVPGVYVARDEIPELGIAAGEYLTIESPGEKNPYMVHRIVTRSLAEMILASPGVLLLPGNRPAAWETTAGETVAA